MKGLPKNRAQLRERWSAGESFRFYFFYGHKPPKSGVDSSCFSQWYVRSFTIEGITYPTAEHWMMAEKARLFKDDEILAEILACETPKEAKALGRKVRGFDQEVWSEHKFEIVVRGNVAKFSQHEDFKKFLLSTLDNDREPVDANDASVGYQRAADPAAMVNEASPPYDVRGEKPNERKERKDSGPNIILVEAAGRDTIWGIGLGKNNPKSLDPNTWRGLNLLGFALNEVRDRLASEV